MIRQIKRDCEFLEAERIMDYSLLVGVHFRDDNTGEKMGLSPFVLRSGKILNIILYLCPLSIEVDPVFEIHVDIFCR